MSDVASDVAFFENAEYITNFLHTGKKYLGDYKR